MNALTEGHPVGCQVGVYYLSYFPKEYRFHFNAHNLIVFGKEDDNYLISDPVMETPPHLPVTSWSAYALQKGHWRPKDRFIILKAKQRSPMSR